MFPDNDEINQSGMLLEEGAQPINEGVEDAEHGVGKDSSSPTAGEIEKADIEACKKKIEEKKAELEKTLADIDAKMEANPTEEERKALFRQKKEAKKVFADEKSELNDRITYLKQCSRVKARSELLDSDILLSVRNLKQFFFFGPKIANKKLKAVSNVSFDVHKGECFGIVGESGCGKTTTGRTIIRLYNPTSGSIYYRGYRIGAGPRWNQKEIKWTKVRYRKFLKEVAIEEKKALSALDKNAPDYQKKSQQIRAQFSEKRKSEAGRRSSSSNTINAMFPRNSCPRFR